ncbi:hypothetical protein F4811DRAFT_513974 [Daldinia bambusicola]|nr:hypothetical protein F4811DRAFT_513974 [Daldinia bambusicola]
MMERSAALENQGTQSGRPQTPNYGAATASRLGEQQQKENYESDVLSPEGPPSPWLESNKENILGSRRSTASRRSVQRTRPRTRSALQMKQRQRRNTLDRLLNLSIGPQSPGSPVGQEEAQISDVLGPMAFWRNRVYRVQKRVGDFLGRTGSSFYPAYGVDETQLDALTVEIIRKENPLPSPPPPQQQQQVSEGESVSYPDLSGQAVGSEAVAPPPPPDVQAQVIDSSDADAAFTVPQRITLDEALGEQQARTLEERLQRLREGTVPPIQPNPGPQEAVPGKAIALASFTPPSSSSAPRSFHISQTAHFAPSFVTAQHHLRQATARQPSPPVLQPQPYVPTPSPPPPPPPSSSTPTPTPTPSRRSSHRRSSRNTSTTTTASATATNATTTSPNNNSGSSSTPQTETSQAMSAQLLWDGATRTREIWFGVGPRTGRDVGGRKGQGKRV